MRLIDADKLMRHLVDWALHDNAPEIRECMKAVDEQPTVDTSKEIFVHVNVDTDEVLERLKKLGWKPVEHGHWIHGREVSRDYIGDAGVAIHYEKWWCSECNYHVDGRPLWNYCPNCGSRMDGENNEID